MKHIKFTFSEPIIGIESVPSEVFTFGPERLCVVNKGIAHRLHGMLMDFQIPLKSAHFAKNGGWNVIRLGDGFRFVTINDEIFVMRGFDNIYVEDELGNKVTDYDTHSDWDIDKVYPICE